MTYYPRDEQETLYNFDVISQVWRVYTTYPPHIKRLLERISVIEKQEKDSEGNTILLEGLTDRNCIRLFAPKTKHKQRNLVHEGRLRNITHRDRGGIITELNLDELSKTASFFNFKCALSGRDTELEWDHVIPQSILKEGGCYGNLIPLYTELNQSKSDSNIFEWFEANRQRFELSQERFDNLISFLAKANGMTVHEYRKYVYDCHNEIKTAI